MLWRVRCVGRLAWLFLRLSIGRCQLEELQEQVQDGKGRVAESVEQRGIGVIEPGVLIGPGGGCGLQFADGLLRLTEAGERYGAVERPGEGSEPLARRALRGLEVLPCLAGVSGPGDGGEQDGGAG